VADSVQFLRINEPRKPKKQDLIKYFWFFWLHEVCAPPVNRETLRLGRWIDAIRRRGSASVAPRLLLDLAQVPQVAEHACSKMNCLWGAEIRPALEIDVCRPESIRNFAHTYFG